MRLLFVFETHPQIKTLYRFHGFIHWGYITICIICIVILSKSYSLVAIINHSGKLNAGHYTATIREKGSTNWLSCNDKSVLPTDLNKFDYSLPYVLFFTKS